jgi:hypothetical protein
MCIGLRSAARYWMIQILDFQNGFLKANAIYLIIALIGTLMKGEENNQHFTQLVCILELKRPIHIISYLMM